MFNGSGREGSRGGKGVGCVVGRERGGGGARVERGVGFSPCIALQQKHIFLWLNRKGREGFFS